LTSMVSERMRRMAFMSAIGIELASSRTGKLKVASLSFGDALELDAAALPTVVEITEVSRASSLRLGYSFCYRGFQQLGTQAKEPDMAKNHYTTKPKRRNRSGKRKDTRRIAANMAKIKELERTPARTA
jgi:hypothetical protein